MLFAGARRLLVWAGLRLALAAVAAVTAAAMAALALARPAFARLAALGRRRLAHPGNRGADQPLDRGHGLAVGRRYDGDGGAGEAGAAGAADAVDVIVRMMRHVEIEDVADGGDIETAGGDIGCDQELRLAVAEGIERRRTRRLIEIAVQRDGVELVLQQRAVQLRDLALAIAEHDGVLEAVGRADQSAQGLALVGRIAPGGDLQLGDGGDDGGGLGHFLSLIHISEPTRLGMISYAVFCLKKKK